MEITFNREVRKVYNYTFKEDACEHVLVDINRMIRYALLTDLKEITLAELTAIINNDTSVKELSQKQIKYYCRPTSTLKELVFDCITNLLKDDELADYLSENNELDCDVSTPDDNFSDFKAKLASYDCDNY